jgi:hypothetical protein
MAAWRISTGRAVSEAGPAPGAGRSPGGAAIVVVSRDSAIRQRIHHELAWRYSTDYKIVTCDYPPGLAAQLRALRAAGTPAALVVGGVSGQDPGDVEVFAAVGPVEPTALRVAAVRWGDWAASQPIVTWAWIAIYTVVPLLMVIILAVRPRTPGGTPAACSRPRSARFCSSCCKASRWPGTRAGSSGRQPPG